MSNEKVYIPTTAILEVVLSEKSESWLRSVVSEDDGLPLLTMGDVQERFVTLEIAKKRLELAHLTYARRLVKESKLEGIKVKVPGGSRWLVTLESISSYKKRKVRNRALRNFIIRFPGEQEEVVRDALDKAGVTYTLELAYVSKPKDKKAGETVWASVIAKIEE
jgi:hypothetical protein